MDNKHAQYDEESVIERARRRHLAARFWEERWQRREREVDAHLEAGTVPTHQSASAFLGRLDSL